MLIESINEMVKQLNTMAWAAHAVSKGNVCYQIKRSYATTASGYFTSVLRALRPFRVSGLGV